MVDRVCFQDRELILEEPELRRATDVRHCLSCVSTAFHCLSPPVLEFLLPHRRYGADMHGSLMEPDMDIWNIDKLDCILHKVRRNASFQCLSLCFNLLKAWAFFSSSTRTRCPAS